MAEYEGLKKPPQPNWQGLVDNVLRKGTPDRVYHIELFHDMEIRDAITSRFDLLSGVARDDPDYERKQLMAVNRFCGFDYVVANMIIPFPLTGLTTEDTAELKRQGGRSFQDERVGPVMSWEDFEKYAWPDMTSPELTANMEWFDRNLPDDMCMIGGLTAHFAEGLAWLMGYETLCYALFDQQDLVRAISERLGEVYRQATSQMLQFERVKLIWGSDDMGFRTGLLISPDDMRRWVLPGHKEQAAMCHEAGRPYILHSCGYLGDIIDDLIDDVKIDAKHSFEDTIEDVREVKGTYGRKIALLGGTDVDFLCRSDEQAIRSRVRKTLAVCQDGGGFCLGTGNSVANYVPLDNYLAMVDEGRLYA